MVVTLAIVNPQPELAAVISTGEVERLYSGLSVLVSAASEGRSCAALAAFSGLGLLLDDDLLRLSQEPAATPRLTWAGRERFGHSLWELRETALGLETLGLYACSASIETMGLTEADIDGRLEGVMSSPRFLRETEGARLLFV